MPSCPRKDVVVKGQVGVYHCWNRCVQRAFLCGRDPVTGEDYQHRRDWIEKTEQILARLFAVDIAFHAELANHIHLILRTRPDVARCWNRRAVIRRWLIVTKLKRNGTDQIVEPTEEEIKKELKKRRWRELRRRLSDVSWFMGTLCESISRRCNRESGTSGTFWEHRFKCRVLKDEAAILTCAIYVDLNQIRAGEALTPEQSRHTSAYNRIQGLRQRLAARGKARKGAAGSPLTDHWLCKLTLDERGDREALGPQCSRTPWRASDKGLLSLSLERYLELLDWSGRQVRSDKPGAIPESLAPILDRLGINRTAWLETIGSFQERFGFVVGSAKAVSEAAQRVGRRWFRGVRHCAEAFG